MSDLQNDRYQRTVQGNVENKAFGFLGSDELLIGLTEFELGEGKMRKKYIADQIPYLVKKKEDDVVDKDPAKPPVAKPAPDRKIPDQAPEAPPSHGNEKTIKALTAANEEQAKLIEELRKQTEQCSTELGQTKASNANLSKEIEALRKAIASLRTERDDLKERFTNASSDAATCSRDLAVAKQELAAAKKVANSPFVNGWVYDPDQGWLFTNAKIYPSIYSSST